ncbi:MAG: signal peptidase II [Actinomycetia bacterium]|nr:signal peptidase II [Actinomycetes bacterium]
MMNKRKRNVLMNVYFLMTGVAVLILDQITKYIVISKVPGNTAMELIPDFLYIVNVKNPGAAFGIFQNHTKILTIISLVAIVLIIVLKVILDLDYIFYNVTLGFILGGALGNLVDRFFVGEVTDFISFTIFPPVFNIADSFIVIGFSLIIILILKEYFKKNKTRGS